MCIQYAKDGTTVKHFSQLNCESRKSPFFSRMRAEVGAELLMLCGVSLHSDLLGRIRGELARRREEHQQFARRIGWTQSKMSRTLC